MLRSLLLVPIALAVAALAFSGRGSPVPPASPARALAPSLAVDKCIEADPGDTFDVAVSAADVTNLMAWDIYYAYNDDILEVVDGDVHEFLETQPNSNVVPLSDPLPNTSGLYHIGAADIGGAGTEEDGSGVLAVLTLRARDEGISWSSLYLDDANSDGVYDIGPTLTQAGGGHIGDTNGDGIFDGSIRGGQIAVGRPCREPAPTPYVDPDVIPVQVAVNTPALSSVTPTPPGPPDGSAPESETPTPDASSSPGSAGRRSSTPEARPGSQPGSGGDSDGGLSPLLATILGAGGGTAIIASYVVFRAVRRPA